MKNSPQFKITATLLLCFLASPLASNSSPASTAQKPQGLKLIGSAAESAKLMQSDRVVIFFSPECPICTESFPTIESLSQKFQKDIEFNLIVRKAESEQAQAFLSKYHPTARICVDENGLLQKRLAARVTPEAFFLKEGKVIYSGRIDDRYAAIGQRRTVIRSNDLADVLLAYVNHKPIKTTHTAAVGCFLEPQE